MADESNMTDEEKSLALAMMLQAEEEEQASAARERRQKIADRDAALVADKYDPWKQAEREVIALLVLAPAFLFFFQSQPLLLFNV